MTQEQISLVSDQPPIPMDGKRFVSLGQVWVDAAGNNYMSNGHGYFEGLPGTGQYNLAAIPERPGVELTRAPIGNNEFSSLVLQARELGLEVDWVALQLEQMGATFNRIGSGWAGFNISWEQFDNMVSRLEHLKIDKKDLKVVLKYEQKRRDEIFERAAEEKEAKKQLVEGGKSLTAQIMEQEEIPFETSAEAAKSPTGEGSADQAHSTEGVESHDAPLKTERNLSAVGTNVNTQNPMVHEERTDAIPPTADQEPVYVWHEGRKIDVTTGDIVEFDENYELASAAAAEVAEPAFSVKDEETARWLINRIRHRHREADRYKQELKETLDQLKVLANQADAAERGLLWKYGQSLREFTRSQIRTKSDGTLERMSIVFPEGTAQLCERGGATCIDRPQFDAWWADMPEEERALYPWIRKNITEFNDGLTPTVVKYEITDTACKDFIDKGGILPGWVKLPYFADGDIRITKSAPKDTNKKKNEAKQ